MEHLAQRNLNLRTRQPLRDTAVYTVPKPQIIARLLLAMDIEDVGTIEEALVAVGGLNLADDAFILLHLLRVDIT